jgi:hypothetical protein
MKTRKAKDEEAVFALFDMAANDERSEDDIPRR